MLVILSRLTYNSNAAKRFFYFGPFAFMCDFWLPASFLRQVYRDHRYIRRGDAADSQGLAK